MTLNMGLLDNHPQRAYRDCNLFDNSYNSLDSNSTKKRKHFQLIQSGIETFE